VLTSAVLTFSAAAGAYLLYTALALGEMLQAAANLIANRAGNRLVDHFITLRVGQEVTDGALAILADRLVQRRRARNRRARLLDALDFKLQLGGQFLIGGRPAMGLLELSLGPAYL
jgi:hypothetical protein